MTINTFTFSGNIGRDVETKVSQGGKTIASFPVAATSGYGDNKKTSWIKCTMLGQYADSMVTYLTKGKPVVISGEFTLDQWEKDGVKYSAAAVLVKEMQLGRSENEASRPPQQAAPQQQPPQQAPQAAPNDFDFTDDIGF